MDDRVYSNKPMTGVFGKSRDKINDDVDSNKFLVDDFYASINNFFNKHGTLVINSGLDGYIGV